MTSGILRNVLKTLNDQKLTKRGQGLTPAIVLDGHVSRTGEVYFEYVTDQATTSRVTAKILLARRADKNLR